MSGSLRILVVANLPPWVMGGAENQVLRLVENWSSLGHHVEVAGHRIPNGKTFIGNVQIKTHRIATFNFGGRAVRAASYFVSLSLLLIHSKWHFDIVYTRGLGDGALSVCLLKALRVLKLPLVACPINARGAGDAHFIRTIPGWRILVLIINRHCEAINIIAPAIEADLTSMGIDMPQLSYIPNGIALGPSVKPRSRAEVTQLIWTGRLSHQKGMDLLLSALVKVIKTGRKCALDIVGDGVLRERLEDLSSQLNLADYVSFTGSVEPNKVRQVLASADAFVLPSRYEGMSNSALEAMEVGLPVLLTRCGGIDRYMDDTVGWFCEPNDEESLFEALCRLLDTPIPHREGMGKNARNLVKRNFEISSVGRRNAAMFIEVVEAYRERD